MTVKLIQGDCIVEMQKLIDDGVRVDLTVTSPPYDNLRNYNGSLNWDFDIFKQVADKLYNITADGGVYIKHFRCPACFEDNCKWVFLRLVTDTVKRDKTRGGRE